MSSPLTPAQALPAAAAGAAASAADTYTNAGGLAALANAPPSPATLHAVAEQVEALFLQMMLKSMRDASEAQGVAESSERGMYEDMFDKQVALTLSQHQDLGFTRLLERQLGGGATRGGATRGGATAPGAAGTGATAPAPTTMIPVGASPRTLAARYAASQPAGEAAPPSAASASAFIQEILPSIRQAARTLGVHPLGLLAQAALETGWGQRMPRNADGTSSLNLFGVKAGEEWSGARAVADTVEFSGGIAQPKRSTFRAYGSIEESVGDFARLLASSPRYRAALQSGASAAGYVAGIAQTGYATDPGYANKLNQILNSGLLRGALGQRTAL
jgi:flagellar protein FlgJ